MSLCPRYCDVIPKGSFSLKPKSIDYNHKERLVLVAGRKILTILKLNDEKLAFNTNLLTKEQSLNCCDAKWSPFSTWILATAEKCTVQLWNLEIAQKDKFQTEFRAADQRALNKISFSRFKPNVLISGSQDSRIRFVTLYTLSNI